MKIKHRYQHDNYNQVAIEEPELCPICKAKIQPQELAYSGFADNKDNLFLSIMHLCKHCYKAFLVLYSLNKGNNGIAFASEIVFIEPNYHEKEEFKKEVRDMSPDFVKIYNQALQAESLRMDEIAGIGYRKAFEFLVKDFFIKLNPAEDDKTKIIDTPLSKFFSDEKASPYKLKNESLNELALASVWIGNDFAHYYRKHEEYNLPDLKELINATLHQISVELFTQNKAKRILESKN